VTGEETLKHVADVYRFDRFVLDAADRRLSDEGSLAALAAQFPAARLNVDHLSLFGEATFGPVSQIATASLEGALFGAAMVFALTVEHQRRPCALHHRH
jgi:hypothetical protein